MNELERKLFSNEATMDRLHKLSNEVRLISHSCYNPECTTGELAIKSHVLQENGVLNNVAEYNGNRLEIVALTTNNLNAVNKTGRSYKFKPSAISKTDVFTFWGFCDRCDEELFKEIEPNLGQPDYSTESNQLLLAYRGLLSELHKMEYNIRLYLQVEARIFSKDIKDHYRRLRLQRSIRMIASQTWKARIEKTLSGLEPSPFHYAHFSWSKIPIAASILFLGETYLPLSKEHLWAARPEADARTLPKINETIEKIAFLHVIPTATTTEFCLAYTPSIKEIHGIPVSQINNLIDADKLKLFGDIIIARGETWCIAPSLYKKWKITGHDQQVLNAIQYHLPIVKKLEEVKINLLS